MPNETDGEDALSAYRKLRDPLATTEPFGVIRTPPRAEPTGTTTWHGDFVIHLHDATRRHYDLRLQMGRSLLSFAVPRGVSLDPAEKRLAVQTENHPIEYLDFEDVIPPENYGAGPMIVWDIGTVRYLEQPAEAGVPKGKLDFILFGHKVRGRFALVETTGRVKPKPKQRQWLLIKKQDAFSVSGDTLVEDQPESVFSGLKVHELALRADKSAALLEAVSREPGVRRRPPDAAFTPLLCAAEGADLDDPRRIYELKLDGVRIVAKRADTDVELRYRSGRLTTANYPEVARALQLLFPPEFVVDGEIVSFDGDGKPRFQRLAARIQARRPRDVLEAAREASVVFLVFDLLALGQWDLRDVPLLRRKALLEQFAPRRGMIRYLDHLDGDGRPLLELCRAQGLEGVVSKVRDSRYAPSRQRSTDWVKHRLEHRDDFAVVGWVSGKGSRGTVGSLELSRFVDGGFVHCGRVGTGFDEQTLALLADYLLAREVPEETATGEPLQDERSRHHVKPELVVSVRYLEWSPEGRLRMPVFVGLRSDIPPTACTAHPSPRPDTQLDVLLAAEGPAAQVVNVELPSLAPAASAGAVLGSPAMAPGELTPELAQRRVQLTNQSKVFWPDEGYTKGDLLKYYEQIAPWLLPHLQERPVMLVRYPDGVGGKSFYQWNVPAGTPPWVRTLELRDEERDGKQVSTFLVDSVDALLHIVNLGCIPVHVLASRADTLDDCDFLTIDFDLGGQPLADAIVLALSLREVLDDLGLRGFPKTSGQTGLHVLIPVGRGTAYPAAKALVELLGRILQSRHPERSTMERRIRERGPRVYIDTGQTGRSRTIVAPYSVRAYAGATVSTPLYWEEVHLALKPQAHTIFSVPQRAAESGDPYEGWLAAAPDIARAVARLERWVKPTAEP